MYDKYCVTARSMPFWCVQNPLGDPFGGLCPLSAVLCPKTEDLREKRRNKMKRIVMSAAVAACLTALATPDEARRAECAKRAAELVAQLTAEERIGQLMMDSPAVDRLGIPKYHWWNEALHGAARAGLATVFPQSIGMAATFDEPLMRRMGDVVSTEGRAKYNLFSARGYRDIYFGLTFWSPNVNMFRDPRWGRGQETFGEDPFLAGRMGGAYVLGLQGDDSRYLKVAACAKHFAVHSGPEALRHGFDARVSPRDMAEYYLPAFKTLAMDAKVEAFMGAYSAINGTPCCADKGLLTDLLRGEWGFRGHIVSDVGAVRDIRTGHHFQTNAVEACKAAIAAGLDLCSEGAYACLGEGLKDGRVMAEELVGPLVRLYTTRALLGQFDPKGSTPWDSLGATDVATDANRALALEAAEKSLVLVSNNGVLPLDVSRESCIAVIGPRACDEIALVGNYCGFSDAPVTCMSGFLREVGPGVKVETGSEGFNWGADLVIACLGITAEDEGEEGCSVNNKGGDRTGYGLPPSQIELLKRLRKRFKRVIAVVFGGSPFDLKPVCELSDAVMLAWYPGEQGGRAVARAVLGRVNPSGRLPITYPQSYDDLPDFKDYALAGRTYRYATKKPAYPFGYGLSYTTFAYANVQVKVEGQGEGQRAAVSVDVTNAGKLVGEEVVQLYVRAPVHAGDRRLHHLEGFTRVKLAPGETKTVTIPVKREQFAVYGEDGRASVPAGASQVFVGGGQPGFAQCLAVEVAW